MRAQHRKYKMEGEKLGPKIMCAGILFAAKTSV